MEELEAQLAAHQEQLAQLDVVLRHDAANAELQRLRAELLDVIQLTTDLIREEASAPPPAANAESVPPAARLPPSTHAQASSLAAPLQTQPPPPPPPVVAAAAAGGGAAAAAAAVYAASLQQSAARTTTAAATAATTTSAAAATTPAAGAAYVDAAILLGKEGGRQWLLGQKCQAMWSDGKFYDAVVSDVPTPLAAGGDSGAGKYGVTFTRYNETARVSAHELRPRAPKDKAEGDADASGAAAGGAKKRPLEPVPIPKSLQVLPEDTEEVRAMKKKKVHAIKSQNRLIEMDEERNRSKNVWQSFVNKSAGGGSSKKKLNKGFVEATKGGSMFRSPEGLDGKVGVVGSGQGLTHFRDVRETLYRPQAVVYKPSDEPVAAALSMAVPPPYF